MKSLKAKVIALTVAVGLLSGGTGYATASMFDELKDDYHKEIAEHVETFVHEDQSKRVQTETRKYLEQKLAERDNKLNDVRRAEADQAIEDIKRFIDNELETYK